MFTYVATFTGRKVGAIGITYPVTVEIEADDPNQAIEKLYSVLNWEHVSNLSLSLKDVSK